MKKLIASLMLLTVSVFSSAELEIAYAPKAVHTFIKGSYINDNIDLLSVKYNDLGVFTMTNSYHERAVGIYTDWNIKTSGRLSLDLTYGAVWGYRDVYKVNFERTEIVYRGKKVIRPIIAPTLNYAITESLSFAFSQYANASILAVKIKF